MKSALSKTSVISHPTRGVGGNNKYRGNCGPNFTKDLLSFAMEHTRVRFDTFHFVDINEGGGTSRDVAREMNIKTYHGLDLHGMGETIQNDFTKDSVLGKILTPANLVHSHPPYGPMIPYSGNMYGDTMLHGDTSNPNHSCEKFLEMSQVMLLNQREATINGGLYSTLIGDMRKNGEFRSYQADYQLMMPKNELISVAIKMQHNCQSNGRSYGGSFVPISHEYLLIWKKKGASIYQIGFDTAKMFQKQVASTWRSVIRIVMMRLGKAKLSIIYAEVEKIAVHMIANNPNYKAKIRQTLQKHCMSVNRGIWAA